MADTVTSSGCAGAGVAIMVYGAWCEAALTGMHSRLWRGQSCRITVVSVPHGASINLRPTLCRWSGEQYQAFWHRLHHMFVGMQHRVHGWLMSWFMAATTVDGTVDGGRNGMGSER